LRRYNLDFHSVKYPFRHLNYSSTTLIFTSQMIKYNFNFSHY